MVVLVGDPEPVRAVLAATYPLLGLDWDPATVGAVADEVPGVTVAEVANALVPRLLGLIASSPTFPVFEARERPARSVVARAHGPAVAASARQRARAAIAEHAPAYRNLPMAVLGAGLDHHAFLVGDLVVRVGADVAREAALLRLIGERLSLPVPRPRFVDPLRGVLAYPLLPGRPLLGRTPPAGAAAQLGRMLAELHAINPADPVDPTPVDIPVEAANPREWLADLAGPPELLRVLHADPPPTSTERVLAHADLGAEHLLAADGRLTGVIDWSDAAVTDPALDFARLYRDFGPTFLDETLARLRPRLPRVPPPHHVLRPLRRAGGPRLRPPGLHPRRHPQPGLAVPDYAHAAMISPSTPAKPVAVSTR